MNELIRIDQDGRITARELYDFLEMNPTQYSRWAKTSILENQFADEGADYFPFDVNVERGAQRSTDYRLSIDFAKKLCMVSKSPKGEQARDYFIEIEKRYNAIAAMVPKTLPEALRLAADLAEANENLRLENAQQNQIIHELQPKATYYDLILQNKSLLAITKIAKDYGLSGTAMNSKLHDLGVQYKQGDTWLLYQKHADKGYTQSKTHVIDDEKNKFHTYWTQKGRLFIYDLLKQNRVLPLIERNELCLVAGGSK
jgi:phage anti-repressor protein/phage antirepressor YoqD-like protein